MSRSVKFGHFSNRGLKSLLLACLLLVSSWNLNSSYAQTTRVDVDRGYQGQAARDIIAQKPGRLSSQISPSSVTTSAVALGWNGFRCYGYEALNPTSTSFRVYVYTLEGKVLNLINSSNNSANGRQLAMMRGCRKGAYFEIYVTSLVDQNTFTFTNIYLEAE